MGSAQNGSMSPAAMLAAAMEGGQDGTHPPKSLYTASQASQDPHARLVELVSIALERAEDAFFDPTMTLQVSVIAYIPFVALIGDILWVAVVLAHSMADAVTSHRPML